jgi:hypothetical protein
MNGEMIKIIPFAREAEIYLETSTFRIVIRDILKNGNTTEKAQTDELWELEWDRMG